ncbi:MAG TPA: hypothetical protein VHY79_17460 [Rhizomicrobium sp.]|nr:hypothetical protein [Rhizomicrobium sp.]
MNYDDLNDDAKHWLRRERFKFFTAGSFLGAATQVRNTVGVYVIFLRNISTLLSRAQLPDTHELRKWSLRDCQHVYTGLSVAMRSRAVTHLCGDVRDSGVRQNLLALQFCDSLLWDKDDLNLPVWEGRLSEWLVINALVGFRICEAVGEVQKIEAELIQKLPSPFNTEGNRTSSLVASLSQKRESFRQHLITTQMLHRRRPKRPLQWLLGATANHLAGEQSEHST